MGQLSRHDNGASASRHGQRCKWPLRLADGARLGAVLLRHKAAGRAFVGAGGAAWSMPAKFGRMAPFHRGDGASG